MTDEADKRTLRVAMITSDLEDAEDLPAGPVVILRGDAEAVKQAAKLFDQDVLIIPR